MPAIPSPTSPAVTPFDESNLMSEASAAMRNALANPGGQSPTGAIAPPRARPAQEDIPDTPADDAIDMSQLVPPAPKADATPAPVPQESHGNGDFWSWSNLKDFMRDEFRGTGEELKDVPGRWAAETGSFLTMGAAGLASVADRVLSGLTGHTHTEGEDTVFDFHDKYIKPAIDYWTPERAEVTGQDQGTGGAAQAIGQGAEMILDMVMGPAGITKLVAQRGIESTTQGIDKGESIKVAAANGAVDALATLVMSKLPGASLPMAKRVLAQLPAGVSADVAAKYAKQQILKSNGYGKEAAKIDPLGNVSEDALQQIIFSVFGGHKEGGKGKVATEVPPAEPAPTATPVPPAVAPAGWTSVARGASMGGAEATPAPAAAPIADQPSAEPAKDLRAQLKDMKDPKTPRAAVFLSKDNLTALDAAKGGDALSVKASLRYARSISATMTLPNGELVFKTPEAAQAASDRLSKGEDPQSVIGSLTGAGEGKQPDQTAVVQGTTPEGAVATESMVRPAEVPQKVAEVKAQGKEPVVTTPGAAVERRQQELAKEHGLPLEPAPEAIQQEVENREGSSPAPTAERAIVKTGAGERAVMISDATPDAEGKVRVRVIDEEGEPGPEVNVPAKDLIRGNRAQSIEPSEAPAKPAKPAEPAPAEVIAKAKSNEPLLDEARKFVGQDPANLSIARIQKQFKLPYNRSARIVELLQHETPEVRAPKSDIASEIKSQLAEARDQLREQETAPKGKKFAAPLAERAQNIATFARALKAAASAPAGGKPEDVQRAITAAKAAERLDMKSDQAIQKGQGIGHTELSVHAENLLNAAEKLINPEAKVPEPKVAKQEKLKQRIEKQRQPIPTAEPARHAQKTEPKVKVMEDVPDERKSRELTKGDQLKLRAAGKRFVEADEAEASARRADIERLISEIYGDRMSPDDKQMFMYALDAERRDRLRPKTRNEEIEDEFSDQRYEHGGHEDEDALIEHFGHETAPDWQDLHNKLEKTIYPQMREAARNVQGFRARDLLQHLVASSEGPMKSFLQKLQTHIPDNTFVLPVEHLEGAAGKFHPGSNSVELKMREVGDAKLTRTFVHELVHAATVHLMNNAPEHEFVREIERYRGIAEQRARARFGDKAIQEHLDYYRGGGAKPAKYTNDLYGLTNGKEFMSELIANPNFQNMLAHSEKYAHPSERIVLRGAHRLATAIFNAIKRAIGITDGREAKLLNAAMHATENVMAAQRLMLDRPDHARAAADVEALRSLDEDPAPLKEEGKLRREVGDRATDMARQFYRSTRGRSVSSLRGLVLANETHDQIVRSNAHWFGDPHSDTNPVRQWDQTLQDKAVTTNKILFRAADAVAARRRLSRAEDRRLGQFQIDSTLWGIDPTKPKDEQVSRARNASKFDQRYEDFVRRWQNLSDDAKAVYTGERDFNEWSARQNRKAAIGAALDSFSEKDVTSAQRQLLYSVRAKGEFDSLVGSGNLIDVGDRNEALLKSLRELAGLQQQEGPYFHLGRHGQYVVHINPEGTKEFATKAQAEDYADQIRDLSPGSKAKVAEVGGKWTVDYKAQYVSMHETTEQAESEAARLREAGFDVPQVTHKVMSRENAPLSAGIQQLVAEASRKIGRHGEGKDTQALTDALRSTFVQMMAARSSYAASKLARKGFAGVKPEEMGRNFAAHAQSTAWNTGQLATVFRTGEALGRLREAAKNPDKDVPQNVVYKRGAVMDEIGRRMQQDVSQYGVKSPLNAAVSKLGFFNFLASASHAGIWMTQNFTTAIPTAGARWGYGKATAAFSRAMRVVAGPSFRAAMEAHLPNAWTDVMKGEPAQGAEDILKSVVRAVSRDPVMGKWAKGDNSPLQQLIDRGAVSSSFANELAVMAHQSGSTGAVGRGIDRLFDYARLLPHMADVFNRVSTGLAGLELTGGDIAKAADLVRETHMDYSQANKSRVFKSIGRVPGFNSITMFRTYTQGMAHLLYSNIKNIAFAETKSRAEAAKTVAGLIVGTSLFAGAIKGAALEPLRLGVYAYNQLFGDSDQYHDLDNAIRHWVSDTVGKGKLSETITGGLPRLLGFDLSSRMGLSDLFLHNPPDLLHSDTKQWMQFVGEQLGPMPQMIGDQKDQIMNAVERGDIFHALMATVPVKQFHDMGKAFDLYSTGKRSSAGGQLTEPSLGNALIQAFGLKPAEVARVDEREATAIGYRQFTNARKDALLKAFANADDKTSIWEKIKQYNAVNPGNQITYSDFLKMQRAGTRQSNTATGGPERDPNVRELLDY